MLKKRAIIIYKKLLQNTVEPVHSFLLQINQKQRFVKFGLSNLWFQEQKNRQQNSITQGLAFHSNKNNKLYNNIHIHSPGSCVWQNDFCNIHICALYGLCTVLLSTEIFVTTYKYIYNGSSHFESFVDFNFLSKSFQKSCIFACPLSIKT